MKCPIAVAFYDCPLASHCPEYRRIIGLIRKGEPQRLSQIKSQSLSNVDLQPAVEELGISLKDVMHYATALARWTAAGFPKRSQEEVVRIETTICRPCEHYLDGRCKKCGCRVTQGQAMVNKIRMATENCPEGKW